MKFEARSFISDQAVHIVLRVEEIKQATKKFVKIKGLDHSLLRLGT